MAHLLLSESLAIKRELGDEWLIANTLMNLGLVAGWEGDHDAAYDLTAEGLALYESRSDHVGVAIAMGNLAHAAMHLGRLDEALDRQLKSLRLFHERNDIDGAAESIERLATLASIRNENRLAARLLGLASVMRTESGTSPGLLDRVALEKLFDSTKSRLDAAVFDAEWENGTEMSVEDAVELVGALAHTTAGS